MNYRLVPDYGNDHSFRMKVEIDEAAVVKGYSEYIGSLKDKFLPDGDWLRMGGR